MPSVSKKQHDFMEAVAHGMKPKKGGPSPAVAQEFVKADAQRPAYQSGTRGPRKTLGGGLHLTRHRKGVR